MSWISGRTRSKAAMALNGSAASGRFVGAELLIDPIGTVFEPLEHSPAPLRSHFTSGESTESHRRLTRRAPMKVFAIGSIVKPVSDEQRKQIMPKEVTATLKHYLDGKIEQFWSRQ